MKHQGSHQKVDFDRLVNVLWEVGRPTDDAVWRVIEKSTARECAVRECGHVLHYIALYRLGHLRSGVDQGTCLVRDPSYEHGTLSSESTIEQTEHVPPSATSVASSLLDMEALKQKLRELEAKYDTLSLESEHGAMEPRIEEALSHAEDLRKQAQALDEAAASLKQEQRDLSEKIQRLILGKQQDQGILDLQWAIVNHERLSRILGKV